MLSVLDRQVAQQTRQTPRPRPPTPLLPRTGQDRQFGCLRVWLRWPHPNAQLSKQRRMRSNASNPATTAPTPTPPTLKLSKHPPPV